MNLFSPRGRGGVCNPWRCNFADRGEKEKGGGKGRTIMIGTKRNVRE